MEVRVLAPERRPPHPADVQMFSGLAQRLIRNIHEDPTNRSSEWPSSSVNHGIEIDQTKCAHSIFSRHKDVCSNYDWPTQRDDLLLGFNSSLTDIKLFHGAQRNKYFNCPSPLSTVEKSNHNSVIGNHDVFPELRDTDNLLVGGGTFCPDYSINEPCIRDRHGFHLQNDRLNLEVNSTDNYCILGAKSIQESRNKNELMGTECVSKNRLYKNSESDMLRMASSSEPAQSIFPEVYPFSSCGRSQTATSRNIDMDNTAVDIFETADFIMPSMTPINSERNIQNAQSTINQFLMPNRYESLDYNIEDYRQLKNLQNRSVTCKSSEYKIHQRYQSNRQSKVVDNDILDYVITTDEALDNKLNYSCKKPIIKGKNRITDFFKQLYRPKSEIAKQILTGNSYNDMFNSHNVLEHIKEDTIDILHGKDSLVAEQNVSELQKQDHCSAVSSFAEMDDDSLNKKMKLADYSTGLKDKFNKNGSVFTCLERRRKDSLTIDASKNGVDDGIAVEPDGMQKVHRHMDPLVRRYDGKDENYDRRVRPDKKSSNRNNYNRRRMESKIKTGTDLRTTANRKILINRKNNVDVKHLKDCRRSEQVRPKQKGFKTNGHMNSSETISSTLCSKERVSIIRSEKLISDIQTRQEAVKYMVRDKSPENVVKETEQSTSIVERSDSKVYKITNSTRDNSVTTEISELERRAPTTLLKYNSADAGTFHRFDPDQSVIGQSINCLNDRLTDECIEQVQNNRIPSPSMKPKKVIKFDPPPRPSDKIKFDESIKKWKGTVLNDDNMQSVEEFLRNGKLNEIGLTVTYREGFCELNKPLEEKRAGQCCHPDGVFIQVVEQSFNKKIFFYKIRSPLVVTNDRKFFEVVMSCDCKKVCFGSQTLILLLLDIFKFQDKRVCYEWDLMDPVVAAFLLDPDWPPVDFKQLVSGLQIVTKNSSNDAMTFYCQLLNLQSLVMSDLIKRLVKNSLYDIFIRVELKITNILAVMESQEIEINRDKIFKYGEMLDAAIKKTEKEANIAAGFAVRLSSTVHLREVLYDRLKLDQLVGHTVGLTHAGKNKSTDQATLKLMEAVHPLPGVILRYRHYQKIKSTYVDGLRPYIKKNSTISTTWMQCSAATGRISSCNPNLQAIPKKTICIADDIGEDLSVRSCFVAKEDYSLLAADFQQIELRLLAHLSADATLIEAFQTSSDIFTTLTNMRFGNRPDENVDKEERERTKTLVYALMYGASPTTVAQILNLNPALAHNIVNKILDVVPCLKEFKDTVVKQCKKEGLLRSLGGRIRLFPHINSSDFAARTFSERQAVNFLIQGSAADVCKASMIEVEKQLKMSNHRSQLLLHIHDELVWQVPNSELLDVESLVKRCMEAGSAHWSKTARLCVPLTVRVTTGKSWDKL